MALIGKTTEDTRKALQRASAWGLPNRPSERGMKAEDIKKAFWKPFLDANGSLLGELDRVVDEINALMAERDESLGDVETLATDAETVVGAINEVREKLGNGNVEVAEAADLTDAINRFYQKYRALIGQSTFETKAKTVIGAINEIKGTADEAAEHANANQYQIEKIKNEIDGDIKPDIGTMISSVVGLRAQTQGIAQSYVLNSFSELLRFMEGKLAVDTDVYAKDLKTGDNLLLIEKNVPDFWFEATDRGTGYETYEYSLKQHNLICYNGEAVCGHLHVAETDYTVIANHATSAARSASEAQSERTRAEEARNRASVHEDTAYRYSVDALHYSHETEQIKKDTEQMVDGVIKLPAIYVKDGSLCVDAPRVATVVEGTLVFRQGDDCPPDKVDKVTPLAGKEYTVAAVDKNGTATSLAADIGTYGGAIPLRDYYGRLRVGTTATMEDHHAASVGYLGKRLEDYVKKIDVDELVGDIETALDNIIAMQNSLIGGGVE